MSYKESAGTAARRTWSTIVAALIVAGGVLLAYQSTMATSSSATSQPIETPAGDHSPELRGRSGEIPDDVTVFDDDVPAVVNLDPDLIGAIRHAATDAAHDGVEFYVNSGWRSKEYQDQLFREANSEYGSKQEAARWVATADTSPHVSGDAIDIGRTDAMSWLSQHGAAYGLCQIYSNEPWHYELRPGAIGHGCPRLYADPTNDPRMQ